MIATPSLNAAERLILVLLGDGEKGGLELVRGSEGRLGRGTVYVTLTRMEDKGYISSRPDPASQDRIGMTRRLYRATDLGQQLRNSANPMAGPSAVHCCLWDSRGPRLACSKTWSAPATDPPQITLQGESHEVFQTEDGTRYSFDIEMVTCQGCLFRDGAADDDDDLDVDYAELDRRRQEVGEGTVVLVPWSEIRETKPPVHLCKWDGRAPSFGIACSETWSTPAAEQPHLTLEHGSLKVFKTEDRTTCYTFDPEQVTCPACLPHAKEEIE